MEQRCSEFVPVHYLLADFYNKLQSIKVSWLFLLFLLTYWPLFSLNPLKTPVGQDVSIFSHNSKILEHAPPCTVLSAFEFYLVVVNACVWYS